MSVFELFSIIIGRIHFIKLTTYTFFCDSMQIHPIGCADIQFTIQHAVLFKFFRERFIFKISNIVPSILISNHHYRRRTNLVLGNIFCRPMKIMSERLHRGFCKDVNIWTNGQIGWFADKHFRNTVPGENSPSIMQFTDTDKCSFHKHGCTT